MSRLATRGIPRVGVPLRLLLGVVLLVTSANAQAPDAGSGSCEGANDCALPTPYCQEPAGRCVECLTDRNCASTGKVCDPEAGHCVECLDDLDCSAPIFYCDTTRTECVECLVDAHCTGNLKCESGECGSCGDGTCSAGEVAAFFPFGVFDFQSPLRVCEADCSSHCEGTHLGTQLGGRVASVDPADLAPAFVSGCGDPEGGDASFSWTAPRDGSFWFEVEGASAGTGLLLTLDGCNAQELYCSQGTQAQISVTLTAGASVLLVIRSSSADTGQLHLTISDEPDCDSSGPTPVGCAIDDPDAGEADSGGAGDAAAMTPLTTLCLERTAAAGTPICEGTECLCEHCAAPALDCLLANGCGEIRACFDGNDCAGVACYNSGACRALVDQTGGLSGPAFRTASALQTCALSVPCELPCPDVARDGGTSPPPSPDAGRLCAPRRVVTCGCDGGTGTRQCNGDGSAFGACECEGPPPANSASVSGCGCRTPATRGTNGAAVAAMLALLGLWPVRRRRSAGFCKERRAS